MKTKFAAIAAALTVMALSQANAAPVNAYEVGGSTLVVRVGGEAYVDNGAVICRPDGTSVGGGCVDFGGTPGLNGAGLLVTDDAMGENVAFQVCIDNNGDNICGGPQGNSKLPCGDDQFFSHNDEGGFHNPIGPIPTDFRRGCPGGEWNGYIVFLCTGVHDGGAAGAHVHQATSGTIQTTVDGEGYGTFCGGDGIRGATGDLIAKAYQVE